MQIFGKDAHLHGLMSLIFICKKKKKQLVLKATSRSTVVLATEEQPRWTMMKSGKSLKSPCPVNLCKLLTCPGPWQEMFAFCAHLTGCHCYCVEWATYQTYHVKYH